MIGNIITAFNSSIPGLPFSGSVEYLVIAGGASGGGGQGGVGGGGGGAGGYRTDTLSPLLANTNYTVTVGAGGAGVATSDTIGNNGNNYQ